MATKKSSAPAAAAAAAAEPAPAPVGAASVVASGDGPRAASKPIPRPPPPVPTPQPPCSTVNAGVAATVGAAASSDEDTAATPDGTPASVSGSRRPSVAASGARSADAMSLDAGPATPSDLSERSRTSVLVNGPVSASRSSRAQLGAALRGFRSSTLSVNGHDHAMTSPVDRSIGNGRNHPAVPVLRGVPKKPGSERQPLLATHHSYGSSRSGGKLHRRHPGGWQSHSQRRSVLRDTSARNVGPRQSVYSSLEFDSFESQVNRLHVKSKKRWEHKRTAFQRWVLTFMIAVGTALVAVFITYCSLKLSEQKARIAKHLVEEEKRGNIPKGVPMVAYVAMSGFLGLLAAIPVALFEPRAAGSGISEIKCMLNGVKIPHVVRITTLGAKVVGIIAAVASGLPVGKEGPMIHSGAILGAGLSQGKSQTLNVETKVLAFRNDKEKRDASVCGASAGVAAAFGAPIGGVLFGLEEGASHWFQSLTWRAFFAAIISAYVTDVFLSAIYPGGSWNHLTASGMFSFGDFDAPDGAAFSIYEIPIFVVVGAGGGLIGAAFNGLNTRVTKFRMAKLYSRRARLLGPVVIASTFALASFAFSVMVHDCKPRSSLPDTYPYTSSLVTFYCDDGEYDELASLMIASSEDAIKQLFHAPPNVSFSALVLVLFFIVYCGFTAITYGAAVPSGLFIPSLLSGAGFGRLVGQGLHLAAPGYFARPGVYGLIGAAAVLGGMARMTISLAVILLESTGDLSFGMPLMVVLMASRWMGNVFNEGLYDIHIHLHHIPLLEHKPPKDFIYKLSTYDIMSRTLVSLPMVAKAGDILDMLLSVEHNGFPVLYADEEDGQPRRGGNVAGLIYRKHLCVLLSAVSRDLPVARSEPSRRESVRLNREASVGAPLVLPRRQTVDEPSNSHVLSWQTMEGNFPRYPKAEDVVLVGVQRERYVDLRPYFHASPYIMPSRAPASQTFRLFRDMGLRHIIVVDSDNVATGIITRHDLTPAALVKACEQSPGFLSKVPSESDGQRLLDAAIASAETQQHPEKLH